MSSGFDGRPAARNGVPIRRFRFGFSCKSVITSTEWQAKARRFEELGFAVFQMSDHFSVPKPDRVASGELGSPSLYTFSPMVGLAFAAAATTKLRVAPHLIGNDFRNPGVLAKDLATLDVLSEGRVEIGVGAGYLEPDYANVGMTLDRPGVRLARLAESVRIMKDLLEDGRSVPSGGHYSVRGINGPLSWQRPYPPFVIGGRGPRILALAGREAATVALQGRGSLTMQESIKLVLDAAGDRPKFPELNVVMLRGERCDEHHLGGALAGMADFLQRQREKLGISYIGFSDVDSDPEDWAPLVARLDGQ